MYTDLFVLSLVTDATDGFSNLVNADLRSEQESKFGLKAQTINRPSIWSFFSHINDNPGTRGVMNTSVAMNENVIIINLKYIQFVVV